MVDVNNELRKNLIEFYERNLILELKCVYDIYEYSYDSDKDELHLLGIEPKGNDTTIYVLDIFDVIDTRYDANNKSVIKVLYLGSKVKKIMDYAFVSQHSLHEVHIEDSDNKLDIGTGAFYECSNLIIFDCNRISRLEESAFSDCLSLKSINLDTVEYIGTYCFSNNLTLKNISLTSIKKFKPYCFQNCRNLEQIYIGEYLECLTFYVFWCCDKLIRVIIDSNCKEFDFFAFPNVHFVLYLKYYDEILSRAIGYLSNIYVQDKSLMDNYN